MVEYIKSKKGYFYKLKKNGEKKRISQEEYNKKNKTRKNKKMIGGVGELIEESDIMHQDDLVCILKPNVKKGIVIYTHYTQPNKMNSLCISGLKTGKQLKSEGVNFGRTIYHPYLFFRAPHYSNKINYATPEKEIISSYGEGQIGTEPRVFIRVDPDRTYVFSSEIRVKIPTVYFRNDGHLLQKNEISKTHSNSIMKHTNEKYKELYSKYYNSEINKSKKTLSEYLDIIKKNSNINSETYNLYSSKKVLNSSCGYPCNKNPINRNSEILVSIPHLTPDYFVLCTKENKN